MSKVLALVLVLVGDLLTVVGRYYLKNYNVSTELFTLVCHCVSRHCTENHPLTGAAVKHGV